MVPLKFNFSQRAHFSQRKVFYFFLWRCGCEKMIFVEFDPVGDDFLAAF